MDVKALKRIWKEFPFVWAILQSWEFLTCKITIEEVSDEFINWLIKVPSDAQIQIELWVKYRELSSDYKSTVGEGILKLTTHEDMSYSQALFRLSGNYLPEYLIVKWVNRKREPHITELVIHRPPKNKTWVQIMHSIKENKLKW